MSKLILRATPSGIQIEKLKSSNLKEAAKVGYQCFKPILPWLTEKDYLKLISDALFGDLSNCYVALSDGKIIGGYFISRSGLPADLESEVGLVGKRGVEGVALFLLPEYRGSGIGKKLRDIPKTLGVDYIWGQHFKDLNNLDNWTNYGREIIFEDENVAITLMKFT